MIVFFGELPAENPPKKSALKQSTNHALDAAGTDCPLLPSPQPNPPAKTVLMFWCWWSWSLYFSSCSCSCSCFISCTSKWPNRCRLMRQHGRVPARFPRCASLCVDMPRYVPAVLRYASLSHAAPCIAVRALLCLAAVLCCCASLVVLSVVVC